MKQRIIACLLGLLIVFGCGSKEKTNLSIDSICEKIRVFVREESKSTRIIDKISRFTEIATQDTLSQGYTGIYQIVMTEWDLDPFPRAVVVEKDSCWFIDSGIPVLDNLERTLNYLENKRLKKSEMLQYLYFIYEMKFLFDLHILFHISYPQELLTYQIQSEKEYFLPKNGSQIWKGDPTSALSYTRFQTGKMEHLLIMENDSIHFINMAQSLIGALGDLFRLMKRDNVYVDDVKYAMRLFVDIARNNERLTGNEAIREQDFVIFDLIPDSTKHAAPKSYYKYKPLIREGGTQE